MNKLFQSNISSDFTIVECVSCDSNPCGTGQLCLDVGDDDHMCFGDLVDGGGDNDDKEEEDHDGGVGGS